MFTPSRRHRLRHVAVAISSTALVLVTATACGGTGTATSGSDTVTVYSADGLGDWYKTEFAKFTAQTKISVNYVEAGSGEVVSRVQKER
jgi:2-aminoethylphosphonate transport system substrate-binding protein